MLATRSSRRRSVAGSGLRGSEAESGTARVIAAYCRTRRCAPLRAPPTLMDEEPLHAGGHLEGEVVAVRAGEVGGQDDVGGGGRTRGRGERAQRGGGR